MNEKVIYDLSELRSRFSIFDESEEHFYNSLSVAIKAVKEQKRKGHWIKTRWFGMKANCCSRCNYHYVGADYDFCPKCGVRMIEPQESEDKE